MADHPHDEASRAAYVHVPFCVHKCGYCDFTVIAGRDDLMSRYLRCLELELSRTLPGPAAVDTLFLGGGTPSYLPASELSQLLDLLARRLPLHPGGEFSVECNPDQFTPDRMDVLREHGVNRVSLGVQSFTPAHLTTLERQHTADDVRRVVDQLRQRGLDNLSLDLIYAVPGQTVDDWEATLRTALSLAPRHISTYGLTWEKGTAFWTRRRDGRLAPADEERERRMYELAMDLLPEHGWRQYELSNFAQPGYECRHNQVYWRAEPYYGFGPGAAAFRGGVRSSNHRSVTTWISRIETGLSGVQSSEVIAGELAAREAVMLGLRQTAGIDLAEYRRKHSCDPLDLNPAAHQRFIETELLERVENALRLTREGRFVADSVMAEFL